jgi:hypothetical protein
VQHRRSSADRIRALPDQAKTPIQDDPSRKTHGGGLIRLEKIHFSTIFWRFKMKKFIVVLATICLAFGAAGNALAYFDYGANSSLTVSVYNATANTETGYDLGILGVDFNLTDSIANLATVDVSDLASTVSVYSTNTAYGNTFGITASTSPGVAAPTILSFNSAVRDIWTTGYRDATTNTISIPASDPKSASTIWGDAGNYKGFVSGGNPSLQPNLAALGTDEFVDIYLYSYDLTTPGDTGVLRINSTGQVDLNPSAVPVPAAVWLLGSGLFGLIGIRRRNA